MTFLNNIFDEYYAFPAFRYSTSTKCWYVTVDGLWLKQPNERGIQNVCEHEQTPEKAAETFIKRLKEAEFFILTSKNKLPYAFLKWDETSQQMQRIQPQKGYFTKDDHQQIAPKTILVPDLMEQQKFCIQRVILTPEELLTHNISMPDYVPKTLKQYNLWSARLNDKICYGWTIHEALESYKEAHCQTT